MTVHAQPSKAAAWLQATRPRVFTAAFVPMGIAGAAAIQEGVFRGLFFLLALVGVMLLQTAANLVNEYADYRRGADELKQAGQGMAIKKKFLSSGEILIGAILSILLGSLIGLFLLTQSGPVLWLVGVGGVLVAVAYTAGPFPLAYYGLGEVAAGVFMGPMIIIGAYYVMAGDAAMSPETYVRLMLISLPTMLMVAAILHANNIRDMEADRAAQKRTLAVIFGLRFARAEYMFLVIATYVSQLLLVVLGFMPLLTLLSLFTFPEAMRLIRIFNTRASVADLHPAQGQTARLHGIFGLLVVFGWLIQIGIERLF